MSDQPFNLAALVRVARLRILYGQVARAPSLMSSPEEMAYEFLASPDQLLALHARLVAFRQWLEDQMAADNERLADYLPRLQFARRAIAAFDAAVLLERPEGEQP